VFGDPYLLKESGTTKRAVKPKSGMTEKAVQQNAIAKRSVAKKRQKQQARSWNSIRLVLPRNTARHK
jgi:hypothetical protein